MPRSPQNARRGFFPAINSEAGVSTFAAEAAELLWEMRVAEADRRSQIEPPAEAACKPSKPPTLASVSKDARKAGIDPARIEIKPDGSYVVDIGKPHADAVTPLEQWRKRRGQS